MENKNLAIGMIETNGYISTINALDTILKVADVEVIDDELIGAGIVVIIIAGDVSSVKEAISAAEKSIVNLNHKFRSNIIANPHKDLWGILP